MVNNMTPTVTIVTLLTDRREFLPLLKACINNQNYDKSKLEWVILDDGVDNSNLDFDFCEEQVVYRISHFVSRLALNIEGLGEKQIRFLLEKGIIKNTDDIFLLKRKHDSNSINLYQYDGWCKKSLENLLKAIEKSSTVSFDKFTRM